MCKDPNHTFLDFFIIIITLICSQKYHWIQNWVVYSSISHQLHRGRAVFLVLIDLSAAFDTVSRDHLLSLLSSCFGIEGSVMRWFSGRSYCLKINNELSAPLKCSVGVPHWIVLGHILFNCVMLVLPKLLQDIDIGYMDVIHMRMIHNFGWVITRVAILIMPIMKRLLGGE